MGKICTSRRRCSQAVAGIAALVSLLFVVYPAGAVSFLNNCTYCHGMPQRDVVRKGNIHYNSQSSSFSGNHKNHLPTVPVAGDCSICHTPVAPTNFSHQNNLINMANSLKGYSSATLRAKYDKGIFFNQTSIPNLTNATCSNVNCHFERKTPVWGSASPGIADTTTCAVCHDALPSSLAHQKHLTAFGSTITVCATCHSNHATEAKPYAHATSAGRAISVIVGTYAGSNSRYLPSQAVGRVMGSCTTTYCHNNGTVAAGAHPAVSWSSLFSTCGECHGNAGSLATGAHAKHLAVAGVTCANCHNATASSNTVISTYANHVNSTVTINFSASSAPVGGTYNGQTAGGASVYQKQVGTVAGACATIICHGSNSGTWGVANADATCVKCHGVVGTTPAAYTANSKTAAPGYNGTGVNTAGITGTISGGISNDAKVGAHDTHLKGTGVYKTGGVACSDCHAVVAIGDVGHMNGSTTMTWSNLARNVGTVPYNTDKGALVPGYSAPTCSNNYCHGSGFSAAVQGTGISASWIDGTYLVNPAATKNATDCYKCHQSPTTSSTKYAHTSLTIASDCSGCHGHNGSGVTHIDGTLQATAGVSSGGSSCYGCHTTFQSSMDSTGATRTATYHHVLGGAAGAGDIAPNTGSYQTSTTDVYCTSCHADHNYFNNGGSVTTKAANLRSDIANASAASPVNTDFLTTGSFGICVSCHNASLTRDTTNQHAGGVAATPVIAGAVFAASMHNYTTMSLFGTQPFAANCVKCHTDEQPKDKQTSVNKFGPHFSAAENLLDDLGTGTNAQFREQYICFRCHSQTTDAALGGTLKSANGKDWYGSNSMRSSSEDTFKSFTSAGRSPRHKISAYSGKHMANETLADIAVNRHVECADCHNPHAAKFGNHSSSFAAPFATVAKGGRGATIANVLAGVSGVTVTSWGAASPTTTWGLNANTYGQSGAQALPVAVMEYQVCFKCHSKAMGATGWFRNMTTSSLAAARWTDLGLEFNPNNASRHPVGTALAVGSQLTAAKLKGGWTPGSIMTCSDCHSTDSTASKGPHGSSVKWMLAGTNKAWPYTTAAGNGGSTGTLFRVATYSTGNNTKDGLFCLNCHTVTASNNWHSNGDITAGQHGGNAIMACASCHVRVPHGGKISRLLQTTKAPARYLSNGSTATSSFDYWGTSTANIKGSTFSSANFNSSCSQHNSGGAGGEAW